MSSGRATLLPTAEASTRRSRERPRRSFISRIRTTDASRRASVSCPSRTARTRDWAATSGSGGSRIMSAPACTARTAASPVQAGLTPAMSMPSVTSRPRKPISRRRRSTMGCESVAGVPVWSSAGTAMCPSITQSTPASTAARNGRSSTESSRARSPLMVASCRWLSTAVSPWPGKCLAVVSKPPECAPATNAAAMRATSSGSSREGSDVDHRVAGIVVDVRDGGEGPVDPEGPPFPRRHLSHEARGLGRASRSHRHGIGQGHHPPPDAKADAALHVRGNQQRQVGRALQLVEQPRQRLDLGVEDHDRARSEPLDLIEEADRFR